MAVIYVVVDENKEVVAVIETKERTTFGKGKTGYEVYKLVKDVIKRDFKGGINDAMASAIVEEKIFASTKLTDEEKRAGARLVHLAIPILDTVDVATEGEVAPDGTILRRRVQEQPAAPTHRAVIRFVDP